MSAPQRLEWLITFWLIGAAPATIAGLGCRGDAETSADSGPSAGGDLDGADAGVADGHLPSQEVDAGRASSHPPSGDLPGWKLSAVEDFASPAALGKVGAVYGADMAGYSGFKDTSGNGIYDPATVLSAHDGCLDWYVHTDVGLHKVATPIPFGYEGQTYGRFAVRFKSDVLPGYKQAFLLWPVDDDWNKGEIDWPEGPLGGDMRPASAVPGTFDSAKKTMTFRPPKDYWTTGGSTDWHVAVIEWTPAEVRFFWDDALIASTAEAVPSTPMRWTLQVETQIGGPAPADAVSGHVLVDWVATWAREN